jgi:hypothetical protein
VKRRLADEYDAAQERGEARGRGGDRISKFPDGKFGPADIGLDDKQLHEARIIRLSARPGVGNARRGTEFNCSGPPCCSQSANRSIPSFRAFENLARNVPARLMFFVADR